LEELIGESGEDRKRLCGRDFWLFGEADDAIGLVDDELGKAVRKEDRREKDFLCFFVFMTVPSIRVIVDGVDSNGGAGGAVLDLVTLRGKGTRWND